MMKTILITGCSSGYGEATARLFLQQGWKVIATMRTPQPELFTEVNDRLLVQRLDVTEEESINHAIKSGIEAFGGIDALVNNAGIGLFSAFEATPMHTVREIFETNTFGAMAVAKAIIPHMRENGAGTIVNVTSSVCFAGMPLVAPYTASKFALEGFTEALSYELASVGIRVKLVEPGYGPGTRFAENGSERMAGLIPDSYATYAQTMMSALQSPASVTMPGHVAHTVYDAINDPSNRLRFPAGPDSLQLATARWNATDEEFLTGMRVMFS